MSTPIDVDSELDSGAAHDTMDWDAYAARITRSSQQHIARLINTIKSQQKEIAQLRARLQASLPQPSAAPSAPTTPATPVVVVEQMPADFADQPASVDGVDGRVRTSGAKRGREEMEEAEKSEQPHSDKRSTQRSDAEEASDVDTAAAESPSSEQLTQPLPGLVVNILPPSPVKPINATAATTSAHQPPHNLDTQAIEHDTHLPQQQQQQHERGGLTAAEHLFDELTEQEIADAETRRRRLQAQSIARDAFNAMKQQHYDTAIQLLKQSLALLPLPAYPPSFIRARLTCYAKLGRRREMVADAEVMWQVWPGSLSAFMRGTVECRGKRFQRAVGWLREAEWRKLDEEKKEKERAVERQLDGSVEVEEVEDVWDVTAEEREMRVVSLQSIRDSLSKVEQRIASETKPQTTVLAVQQQASGQQQPQPLVGTGGDSARKDGSMEQDQVQVAVVDEKGKGGSSKRVTFVAVQSQQSLSVPTVT